MSPKGSYAKICSQCRDLHKWGFRKKLKNECLLDYWEIMTTFASDPS